jgi:hypothetical protein
MRSYANFCPQQYALAGNRASFPRRTVATLAGIAQICAEADILAWIVSE